MKTQWTQSSELPILYCHQQLQAINILSMIISTINNLKNKNITFFNGVDFLISYSTIFLSEAQLPKR